MTDTGLRASWEHLKLAGLALWHPARVRLLRLPQMSGATRIYLLNNAALYAVAAGAFLLPMRWIRIGVTGLAIVDGRLPHLAWGLSVLVVCVANLAAALTDSWTVWLVCAVGTACWATAWAVVTLLLAHEAGVYAGAVLWIWLVIVHFLFIRNQLVPLPDSVISPQEQQAAAEEHRLMEQLARAVSNDNNDDSSSSERKP